MQEMLTTKEIVPFNLLKYIAKGENIDVSK